MSLKMPGNQGKCNKRLSKDTAMILQHTYYLLVELIKHLLEDDKYKCVCLSIISTYGTPREGLLVIS